MVRVIRFIQTIMYDTLIGIRNSIFHTVYQYVLKPYFFSKDPEDVHDKMLAIGKKLGSNPVGKNVTNLAFGYKNKSLERELMGIRFPNPIGLSAGFDKNAELYNILPSVGFGFAELGSITAKPYEGNPKPRLTRLPKSKSLVINYGLKNLGADKLASKLEGKKFGIPIFISIAKTNCKATVDVETGVNDYFYTYKLFLEKKIDNAGFVINISCPNTFGGEPFTDKAKLNRLLKKLFSIKKQKPVLIKLSPDLDDATLYELLEVCKHYPVDGFVCSNLTKDRKNPKIYDPDLPEKGGISGKVQEAKTNEQIKKVRQKMGNDYVIVGCGGVFNSYDAKQKLECGADLIELITGMIYEGPQAISEINRGLAD